MTGESEGTAEDVVAPSHFDTYLVSGSGITKRGPLSVYHVPRPSRPRPAVAAVHRSWQCDRLAV